jgi:hypothetical protein
LAETTNCNSVSAVAGDLLSSSAEFLYVASILYILYKDIVGTRFDGYTIISSLVDHVRQDDVVCIHGVESIGILDPVDAVRCVDSCGIVKDIIKPHICAIHNIE